MSRGSTRSKPHRMAEAVAISLPKEQPNAVGRCHTVDDARRTTHDALAQTPLACGGRRLNHQIGFEVRIVMWRSEFEPHGRRVGTFSTHQERTDWPSPSRLARDADGVCSPRGSESGLNLPGPRRSACGSRHSRVPMVIH